jgi:hypothetical protein
MYGEKGAASAPSSPISSANTAFSSGSEARVATPGGHDLA